MPAEARRPERFGDRVSDSRDAGSVRFIRPRGLPLEQLVGGQQMWTLEVDRLLMEFMNLQSKDGKAPPSFSRRPLPAVWSALAVTCAETVECLQRPWSCAREAHLRPWEMQSLKPSSFLAPKEGGVRSWVILLFSGGRYDQSRLKTMSVGGTSVREASTPAAAGQAAAQPEPRRVPGILPSCCRKSADRHGTISRPPFSSFGWTEPKIRECWSPCRSAGAGSRPGHASPTPPRLLRLWCMIFSARRPDLQRFFLNRGIQCARLDLVF